MILIITVIKVIMVRKNGHNIFFIELSDSW